MNKPLNLIFASLLVAALPLQSAAAETAVAQAHSEQSDQEAAHRHSAETDSDAQHAEDDTGHTGGAAEDHVDEHEGHEEAEEPALTLSVDLLREFGSEIATADAGNIRQQVSLPGEVQLNKEAVAHISPRFAAKIVEVRAKIGDKVTAGQTLAVAESSETLARFNLQSLIDGVVINREVTLGEHLSPSDTAFVVADISKLWVDVALYPKQLPSVKVGQPVRLSTSYGPEPVEARVDYVAPSVDEGTRTGLARVFLSNDRLAWKPGMFVQSDITIGEHQVEIAIPKTAIIDLEGQPTVFVKEGERWEPRQVKLGRGDGRMVEVLKGIESGETYVADGGFVLKAELQKNEFESGHNH